MQPESRWIKAHAQCRMYSIIFRTCRHRSVSPTPGFVACTLLVAPFPALVSPPPQTLSNCTTRVLSAGSLSYEQRETAPPWGVSWLASPTPTVDRHETSDTFSVSRGAINVSTSLATSQHVNTATRYSILMIHATHAARS